MLVMMFVYFWEKGRCRGTKYWKHESEYWGKEKEEDDMIEVW
jgi:hypothetical protein